MHLDTILGLITEREATARQTAEQVRAQITALTAELTRVDAELADLTTTRNTLRALAATVPAASIPRQSTQAVSTRRSIYRTTDYMPDAVVGRARVNQTFWGKTHVWKG